ncbi:unnamed protein product [Closterium sp. NIES-64]|nr:unnamed protein product [Closterium sp. NIES-64]
MAAAPQHVDGVHPPAPGSGDRDVDHTQSSIPAVGSAEGVVPGLPVASSDGNGILAGNVNGDGGLGTDGGMDGGGGTTGLEDQTTGGDQSVATPMTERKREKQMEVFVGGLDKDASEEDVKRVFGRVGQIAHVRLPRDSATGRNKGYCFVQYATEGAARRAASELDRILVRGRPVGVLGGEQEDTLFIGNINKTWSKAKIEAVLAGAGVGAWEALTFMEDPQHAGHNRGFAFLEFASHRAAAAAKQRLQQADVSLGVDRPPRVSWAAPLNEPDQRVMAQVRGGMGAGACGRGAGEEHFRGRHAALVGRAAGGGFFFGRYGQIERVVLARNLPSAKRQDYGFINYTTREAALAAIAALNGSQVVDGNFQMKMRVTLAKPQDRKPRHPPPGGRAGGGEQRRADFGDGSVTALLEALREQAEREERGEGAQGAQAGEGEGAGAEVKTEGGGDGSSGVGTGKGVKQEGGGVGGAGGRDLKLSNKTPLSMLNELAMRNKIEVTYELKGEPTGPFDASPSLGGGPNAIPWVCGEARAGMKLRAKQMAAAAALEALLQAGVGESELTRPGQARLKQMGKGKGGRGSPGGAQARGARGYGGAQYSAVQQYGGKYGGASYGGSPYGGAQYGGAAYEGQYGRAEGAASGGKRPYPPADNPDGLHASQRPRTDPYAPAAPPTRSAYSNPPPAHPYSAPPPPHPYSTPPAHPYTNPPPTHPPPSNPPSSYPSAHTYPAPPSYPPSYSYPPAPSAPYGTGGASSAPAAPPPPAPPPYYQQQHPQSQQAAGAGSGSSAGGAERSYAHSHPYSTQPQPPPPQQPYQPPYQQPQQYQQTQQQQQQQQQRQQAYDQKPPQPPQQQQQQQQSAAGVAERGRGGEGGGQQQEVKRDGGGQGGYAGGAPPPSTAGGYGGAYGGAYAGLYGNTHAAATSAAPAPPAAHASAPPAQAQPPPSAGQSPAPAGCGRWRGGSGCRRCDGDECVRAVCVGAHHLLLTAALPRCSPARMPQVRRLAVVLPLALHARPPLALHARPPLALHARPHLLSMLVPFRFTVLPCGPGCLTRPAVRCCDVHWHWCASSGAVPQSSGRTCAGCCVHACVYGW